MEIDGHFRRQDQWMDGRAQRASHQRNAELLDAEAAGRPSSPALLVSCGIEVNLVIAEFGLPGNRPRGLGGSVGVPLHGQLVLLVAAEVSHNHTFGKIRRMNETEAARNAPAQEVLHM